MGNCAASPEQKEMRAQNREVEKLLMDSAKQMEEEVKLLLLGPGESGKSTIFKQMKILQNDGGFKENELKAYKFIVYSNCITQMKVILNSMDSLNLEPSTPEAKQAAVRINEIAAGGDAWTPEVGKDIKILWLDSSVKQALQYKNSVFQLNDSAEYFFDEIDRFIATDYVPTTNDVLRARVRSTGIEEAEFKFDDLSFCMLDVGGQRSERRKWIHCFDSVTAVLYCGAMADYDQQLREDATQNRMKETLQLFDEIVNSPWFENTTFILFLNKKDLFEQKIQTETGVTNFKKIFPEYEGGTNYKKAAEFLQKKFLEKNMNSGHEIYCHQTCAIDTENINVVMAAVRTTLMKKMMSGIGFY